MNHKNRMDTLELWEIIREEVEDVKCGIKKHIVNDEIYLADEFISKSGTYRVETLQIDSRNTYVVINNVVYIMSDVELFKRHRELISMLRE